MQIRSLCLDENAAPVAAAQPLPMANRFLAWSGFFDYDVTSAAADLRRGDRFYFVVNDGAVYATDCVQPPTRIGQRSWFRTGVGRLATTLAENRQDLYWNYWGHLQRYTIR